MVVDGGDAPLNSDERRVALWSRARWPMKVDGAAELRSQEASRGRRRRSGGGKVKVKRRTPHAYL